MKNNMMRFSKQIERSNVFLKFKSVTLRKWDFNQ